MPLLRAEFQRHRHLLKPPLIHDVSQVLYLPFDKDDGSYARDRSGHGNHGAIYGATRVAGKIGSALSFDAVDDYVKIPYNSEWYEMFLGKKAVSFAVWVKLLSAPSTYGDVICNNNCAFIIRVTSGRLWLFWVRVEDVWSIIQAPAALDLDTWYHLAVVYDGSYMRQYVNGTLVNSKGETRALTPLPYNTYIGATTPGTYQLNAIIDEARIHNRALSQAEIRRVMNMRGI